MNSLKIGFTGTRVGLRPDQVEKIISLLDRYSAQNTGIVVSHGDCVGADTDFHRVCVEYRKNNPCVFIQIHIYPPIDPKLRQFNVGDRVFEPDEYLKRNLAILRNSDVLIACVKSVSVEEHRSGTWSTIRQAKKRKIPIELF